MDELDGYSGSIGVGHEVEIGNGSSIKIWGDRWLPSRGTFKIKSPNKSLPLDAMVDKLLNASGTT